MGKRTKKSKNEEENPDLEDLPESVLEILALIGSAAKVLIDGGQPDAFSGNHGDFIFSLIYDPSNQIDQEMYISAIVDVIKKFYPYAFSIDVPSPISDTDETNDEI
jgi:hypothetical protein